MQREIVDEWTKRHGDKDSVEIEISLEDKKVEKVNKLDITQTDFARIGLVLADDGRPALLDKFMSCLEKIRQYETNIIKSQ